MQAGGAPRAGSEHELESQILAPDPSRTPTTVLGGRLIDGVNAFPLARDGAGGRAGNVEADLLLLVESNDSSRVILG